MNDEAFDRKMETMTATIIKYIKPDDIYDFTRDIISLYAINTFHMNEIMVPNSLQENFDKMIKIVIEFDYTIKNENI